MIGRSKPEKTKERREAAFTARLARFLALSTLFAVLFSIADIQLVQWTSRVIDHRLLVHDFMALLALFWLLGATLTALLMVAELAVRVIVRPRSTAALIGPIEGSISLYVCFFGFYHLSRARLEGLWIAYGPPLWWSVAGLAGALALAFRARRRKRSSGVASTCSAGIILAVVATYAPLLPWILSSPVSSAGTIALASFLVLTGVAVTSATVAWTLHVSRLQAEHLVEESPSGGRLMAVAVAVLIVQCGFTATSHFVLRTAEGIAGQGHRVSRRASAAPNSPNVIMLVLDTVRARSMSVYGYPIRTTPNLERFADRSYSFEKALANSSWSLPSHATLFTGLFPHQHGAHAAVVSVESGRQQADERVVTIAQRPLSSAYETVAETLVGRGYATAAIVANYGYLATDFGLLQGFEYIDSRPRNLIAYEAVAAPYLRRLGNEDLLSRYEFLSSETLSADLIRERAVDWLDDERDSPFFLFLNFMDAHAPYVSHYPARDLPEASGHLSVERDTRTALERRYDASIAYLDHQIGILFDELKARGLFHESLVIVTSDHGETFRDRDGQLLSNRRRRHGVDLRHDVIHIPLLVKVPGQTMAVPVEGPAQLVDVVPTIHEVLGLSAEDFPGSAFGAATAPVLAENYFESLYGSSRIEVLLSAVQRTYSSSWALIEDEWKLVTRSDGERTLYNLAKDPSEYDNLVEKEKARAEAMEGRLWQLLPTGLLESLMEPSTDLPVSEETLEKLRSLGYIQ